MVKKIIILLQLTFCLFLSTDALPIKFYSSNSYFGISIRGTNSLCKDRNGFIWASSKTGILRLTDDDYRIYQLPYQTAGVIMVKLVYEHSSLIAYTNNGQIFRYNEVFDRFELLINIGKILVKEKFDLFAVTLDDTGDFWIALSTGLYKLHAGKLSLIDRVSTEKYTITWFDSHRLIIAKSDAISLLDITTLKSKRIFEVTESLFFVSSLLFDKKQDKLWVGTFSNGLFCYDFKRNELQHILKSTISRQPVLAIKANTDSTLLVGVDGQGLWELSMQGNKLLNVYKESADDPYSLRGDGVYDILCEPGKRVWVCTISGGVSYYELASPLINQYAHHINNPNSLVNNYVNRIIEDKAGKIWFATNNGISRLDVATNKWANYYCNKLEQSQVFLTLCEDDHGRIWAGTYSSGIYVLDGKTGQELAHYSRNEKTGIRISNFILDTYKDSEGDLWIGGIDGEFTCYLSKENRFRTYTVEPISAFSELEPNQIILGYSYGISVMNKQTGSIKNLLSGIVVQALYVLGDIIWIGTSGQGLLAYNFKTGRVDKYTTQQGLASNFINSLYFHDNYLWIGTEGGLCRFSLKDKNAVTFPSIFLLSGVSYNKCTPCLLSNGQMAWGTGNGAVLFNPNSMSVRASEGKIFFQEIMVSGRSIRELASFKLTKPVDSLQEIDLAYSQNTFNLELLPLGGLSGAKFSWKLDRFDKDWSLPSTNRIITYTNIPSGRFILKIKLYNSSLSEVVAERAFVIRVIPPFWRTGWFWALLSMFASGIVFLYFMFYLNRLQQKHSEEKIRFFTNTAHDIRNSLTLIKAPVEELSHEKNLSESGKYYLHLATDQARKLSSVVTQLLDFQKIDIGKETLALSMTDLVKLFSNQRFMFESFAKSKNIKLEFISEQTNYLSAVDEQKIEKVIINLISNALKYSHSESCVQIHFKGEADKWILVVKDEGIGIGKTAQRQLFKEFHRGENAINSKVIGSGIGLLLVKNYVELHGGKISCESQENVGSSFQVVVPYKKVENEPNSNVSLSKNQVVSEHLTMPIPAAPEMQDIPISKDIKVLLVEDNDDLLNFMRSSLSREFDIYSATDGNEAWELIAKQLPDLVVSDVMMPNKDGFELCQALKSTYETSHIPIILLTGLSEKTEQLRGLGLGADDYLIKPFDMGLLVQRIKSIIRNRQVVRDKAFKLSEGNPAEQILPNDLNDKFLKRILEVAKANISNTDFNKDDFASALNISPSLLYKKIKALTDLSPTDFIKTVRLDYSLELLKTRKYSINEISSLCGFVNMTYFSTVFRKHFGKSPTQYLG
jgi:signal transduction histidine kinase/DNA-binding response OmpR family regulator/ligand-binding sensor domain-containing protein